MYFAIFLLDWCCLYSKQGGNNETFEAGFNDKIQAVLLRFGQDNPERMALFQDYNFVESYNDNYNAILDVAKSLNIIE